MKQPASKRSRPKTPGGRRVGQAGSNDMSQATTDDFEREDMGIAPKE
jgi:hypothetical protein